MTQKNNPLEGLFTHTNLTELANIIFPQGQETPKSNERTFGSNAKDQIGSIEKNDDFTLITFELCGVKKKDITLTISEGYLILKAVRKNVVGKVVKTFNQRFTFPKTLEESPVKSIYDNGLLELTFTEQKKHVTNIEL
jgi:HSP20 family molecular chaperone IbpA